MAYSYRLTQTHFHRSIQKRTDNLSIIPNTQQSVGVDINVLADELYRTIGQSEHTSPRVHASKQSADKLETIRRTAAWLCID
jgi:hypothetical protein